MRKVFAVFLVLVLVTGVGIAHYSRAFNPSITIATWPHNKSMAFTIACDDVSSGYPLEYLQEIRSLLNSYNVKATFFVIPYHGEWDLLTKSPQLVQELHELTEDGHEIGLHGYAHYQNEFVCQPEKQRELLEKALDIMNQAGITVKGFRAPNLQCTDETPFILKEYNFVYDSSIFGESGEPVVGGPLPRVPSGHEYTWYLSEEDYHEKLSLAEKEADTKYREKTVFSVMMHMKAVNEGEGMKLLDELLSYVTERDVWSCTLLELVEWEKAVHNVSWDARKTLLGGEITFYNVPEGLSLTVTLPSYYAFDLSENGIDITCHRDDKTCEVAVCFEKSFDKVTLPFTLSSGSLQADNELESIYDRHLNSGSIDNCSPLERMFVAGEMAHMMCRIPLKISGKACGLTFILQDSALPACKSEVRHASPLWFLMEEMEIELDKVYKGRVISKM
jgi:predicted deacetylase